MTAACRCRVARHRRLNRLASATDTRNLIETAVTRFLDEVPALAPLKLVVGLELQARHDVQLYRVELPGPKISKDIASDSKVTLTVQRARFNELAAKGTVSDWEAAFASGEAKATGVAQILKLIAQVVARHQERGRTRRPTGAGTRQHH